MDLNAKLKSIENYMRILTIRLNEVIEVVNGLDTGGTAIETIDPTDPEQ